VLRRKLGVCLDLLLIVLLLVSYTSWRLETPLSEYLAPRDEYVERTEAMLGEVVKDVAEIRMLDYRGG